MIPIAKPIIDDEAKRLVNEVLDSGMLVQGPKVAELERQWAAACDAKHAIAVVNGTVALHAALLAHGIGAGDEVITTPFTFMASVNSILYVGATPVFVDVLPCCFNLDPDQIEAAITPRTKAIIPVHLYGLPAQMDKIEAVARKHNLVIIEDAAQAIGARFGGRKIGSANTSCFSLYATKNVMSGEGGMITTDDDAVARACRLIRQHGSEKRYHHEILGYNFRLSDLHAAIGIAQMARLDEFTAKRQANAAYLNAHISNPKIITPQMPSPSCAQNPNCGLCQQPPNATHVWHQYTIRCVEIHRDEAVRKLTEAGIGTSVFYPIPAHKQPHVVALGLGGGSFPISEQLANDVISLPVHPSLSPADLACVVAAVNGL